MSKLKTLSLSVDIRNINSGFIAAAEADRIMEIIETKIEKMFDKMADVDVKIVGYEEEDW